MTPHNFLETNGRFEQDITNEIHAVQSAFSEEEDSVDLIEVQAVPNIFWIDDWKSKLLTFAFGRRTILARADPEGRWGPPEVVPLSVNRTMVQTLDWSQVNLYTARVGELINQAHYTNPFDIMAVFIGPATYPRQLANEILWVFRQLYPAPYEAIVVKDSDGTVTTIDPGSQSCF